MWYVVQVTSGKERKVLQLVERFVEQPYLQECFIPQREIMKRFKGEWIRCTEILLPGYLFLVTNKVRKVAEQLHQVPAFTKLLGSSNNGFVPLSADEISFIDSFTTENHRIVEMSEGVIEGDKIVITKGPLAYQAGQVTKIDRHKRLAYLETTMCGRTVTLRVGLEIVRKRNGTE